MKKTYQNYPASCLGLLFTVGGVLLTFSFVVPFISLIPSYLLISAPYSFFAGDVPYYKAGNFMIGALTVLFFLSSRYYFLMVRKRSDFSAKLFILYMVLQVVILQPLGYELYYFLTHWENVNDGQAFFNIFYTFPVVSAIFLPLGVFFDSARKYNW
jgi:hypothetical protein